MASFSCTVQIRDRNLGDNEHSSAGHPKSWNLTQAYKPMGRTEGSSEKNPSKGFDI